MLHGIRELTIFVLVNLKLLFIANVYAHYTQTHTHTHTLTLYRPYGPSTLYQRGEEEV